MRRRMRERPKGESSDSGARYSLFVTPRGGLSSMVESLVGRLPHGAVRLSAAVERLEPAPGGRWLLAGAGLPDDAAQRTFDAVILATSATAAGKLLAPADAKLGQLLGSIEHSGTAIVTVAYRREQISHRLGTMGAVVPAIEKSPILAVSFSSLKYAHRAPEGHVLIRVFAGGARSPELAEMPDEGLRPLMLGELSRLLGIRGEPVYCTTAHWPRTMPQYHVGHKQVAEQIKNRVASLPGLALAGNYLQGVGIPHCICTGQEAAQYVVQRPVD
jgi:protoporphyrinogen/coproporphyrinogen III oxidase